MKSLIEIGMGQAYRGSCLDLMSEMEGGCVDLTVTSPPYDDMRSYNRMGYLDWRAVCRELFRVTSVGGAVVWIVTDQTKDFAKSLTSFEQALFMVRECGFILNDTMIWDKGRFTNVAALKTGYAQVHEFMFIFTKGPGKTFNPIIDRPNKSAGTTVKPRARKRDGGMREKKHAVTIKPIGQRFNIWRIPPAHANEAHLHPARMPLELAADHITSWSNPGDVVFDPFGGSMTTALAAEKLGRYWLTAELDPEYFEKGIKRLKEAIK